MSQQDIRYSRQIGLDNVGPAGQERLAGSAALVIGTGGLGSAASLYLARAGLGRLVLNDFDTVDESNLPRQILYTDSDLNRNKATVAAERLQTANPEIALDTLDTRLDRDALVEHARAVNIVLDCTDNFASRWLINEVCAATETPLVTGAAIRTEGQVSLFRHDRPAGPCYRCLYSEEDENLNDCAGQGILGPVAGMIGCMMATEALKFLLGMESGLEGKLWVHDAVSGNSRKLNIPVREDCPVCRRRSKGI